MIDRINPFIKLVTVLVTSLLLMFSPDWRLNTFISVIVLLLLFTSKRVQLRQALKIILPALFLSFAFFITGWQFSHTGGTDISLSAQSTRFVVEDATFLNGLRIGTRIFSFAVLGLLTALTIYPNELIASMVQQGKLSNSLSYGVLASVYLIPSMRENYSQAKLAYQVRQIKLRKFDYRPMIGLLIRSIRWSDALAMAMHAKGFSEERTHYIQTKVKWYDVVFLITLPLMTLIGLVYLRLL
ncbi:energy-coupling factor transporter transmembrane component T family protein [Desemzia incerta]|uniref:energy-coupling factor transporter transmembrane component T family protein n=1 Tax=Desemzia incerta TaxID=82801 RepID=UPI0016618240|nr:energy-coupling factor transporter transmembrane component T [Desemzia incerta]